MNRERSGGGNVIMKKIHSSRQLALKPGFGLGEETREQCCAPLGTNPAAAAVSRSLAAKAARSGQGGSPATEVSNSSASASLFHQPIKIQLKTRGAGAGRRAEPEDR